MLSIMFLGLYLVNLVKVEVAIFGAIFKETENEKKTTTMKERMLTNYFKRRGQIAEWPMLTLLDKLLV